MGAGRLWLRPGESDPEAPGVKALEQAVDDVRGEPGEVRKFNGGWVDAVELMRTGADGYGTPAVITFGPGDFEQAHAVDEHIKLTDVAEAAEIYAARHAYAAAVSAEDAHFIARPISISRAYEQLAGQIRARILAGELAEGERLPSELALARDAQVSRGTVREALRLLEEAGFVERTSPRILVVRHPRGDEPAVREARARSSRATSPSTTCTRRCSRSTRCSPGWPPRRPTRPRSRSSSAISRSRSACSPSRRPGAASTTSST